MKCSTSAVLVLLLSATSAVPLLSAERVDPRESRRFVGREDDVRVDAQLIAPVLRPNGSVRVVFEIQNLRKEPIALDPLTSSSDYDVESGTATLIVGAEVPSAQKRPRLVVLRSGEKKTFTVGARMTMPLAVNVGAAAHPRLVQVRVNYLGDVRPFEPLVEGSSAVDSAALFPLWIDNNIAVVTNAVPFEFAASPSPTQGDASASSAATPGAF